MTGIDRPSAAADVMDWLDHETARGTPLSDLEQELLAVGWSVGQAAALLTQHARRGHDRAAPPPDPDGPAPALAVRHVAVQGRTLTITTLSSDPPVFRIRGLLDLSECAELIARARHHMRPSETVNKQTGAIEQVDERTSEGMFFARAADSFIARLEDRIALVMGHPVAHGEALQVLRYGIGGEYRPHHDYFDPDHPGSSGHLAHGGQRVATLIMYLQAPDEGGATEFPDLGVSVPPVAGDAVLFSYSAAADSNRPDARCLHAGRMVVRGEKWIATKWVRAAAWS